ncbi:isoprenoid synthase domain-containing protein [Ampelomyces quisqualis]|uniref:Terpene synthase n=1 Tax=Ampelomyces quisqualis TaxID=50730 RepID=A0A6A5QEY0_AMPQU|nr:isoprenoid synthase domain-containing protein [Ampelomyces quisqualis]
MSTREALLDRLKGQEIVIPDLYAVFSSWVQIGVNTHYQELVPVADERLETIFEDKHKLSALRASDFAFFASTWWPRAHYDELRVLMFFTIWLFNWDDEIDEPMGCYSEDLDAAEEYRSQTIDFVLECLGLHDRPSAQRFPAQNKIIASFREIGEPLAKDYTIDQRKRFMEELTRFMEKTSREQQFRLCCGIPSVEEYWSFRMGTSAVGLVVAVQEYAMNIHICDSVMRKDTMIKSITDETIINISIVNDLLSLRKEISKGCIDSIVPIYCAQGMSVQNAVNEAVRALEASKSRFDKAAQSLSVAAQQDPLKYKHVSEWVEGCQSLCMGNLVWSLATGRYDISQYCAQSDGCVRFTL